MEVITQHEQDMLKNIAYEKIRDYIDDNNLRPGSRLPAERDLAQSLGVSRNVIREALGTLEALGYITKRQGKGIFLKEPDLSLFFREMLLLWGNEESRMRDILDFRLILEQAAVMRIVDQADISAIEKLELLIDESERDKSSIKSFVKHDYKFHRDLLYLSGNPFMIQLTDVVNQHFQMVEEKEGLFDASEIEKTISDHRLIVKLLKKRDKAGLLELLRRHFNTV